MLSLPLRAFAIVSTLLLAPALVSAEDDAGGDAYPVESIDRPFTLPQGAWQAGIDVFADESFDGIGMSVGGDYGVIDPLQVGLFYSFALKDFDAEGDLGAAASYLYYEGDKLAGMAFAEVGYSFAEEGLAPLGIGSLIWYTISDTMAVYTCPALTVALEEVAPDVTPIFLSLPVTFALQATTNIYAELSTELASIEISDSETLLFGADYVPASVTAIFSPDNKLDIGAGLSWDDISDDAGSLEIFALVRYRGGI